MMCPACHIELPPNHRFCGLCGRKLEEAVAAKPARGSHGRRSQSAVRTDRRDVTIMFADVIGFTTMCERLDPEEVHALMNECFKGLGHAIREQGGHVDKYIGDCVMALFGAPVAHEDDAARACRAALDMQVFLAVFAERYRQKLGVTLRMRIGINAGLVIAGEIGSSQRKDYSVMGDMVNLASRLESVAPADGILVSREIVQRVGSKFEFGAARLLSVKGKEQPVEAYELLRESLEGESFRAIQRMLPMVGRNAELQDLLSRWEHAAAQSRWIEIRGETGLGKTRLIQEAERRMTGKRLLMVDASADPARRPFGLLRLVLYNILRATTGQIIRPDSPDAFTAALTLLGEDVQSYVNALWYLAAPSRLAVPAPDPDPQSLRQTLEKGLVLVLDRFAKQMPTMALFLDSYGLADEVSADLLESLGRRREGWPMPVIVSMRYGGRKSLFPDHVIHVERLSQDGMDELLNQLVPDSNFSATLRRELLRRVSGVPGYLQELVYALEDQGVLTQDAAGQYRVASQPVGAVSLPSSLRAAMVGRLDHLDQEQRELVSQCAVQGVEFHLDVAEAVWKTNAAAPSLEGPLRALELRGLVKPLEDGKNRWMFRLPLMQEACYETLLRHDRCVLHSVTAEALIRLAGNLQAVAPELLAYHYENAEVWSEAAAANLRAGDHASRLFLNAEAKARYARALEAYQRIKQPLPGDGHVAALAYGGLARVELRSGTYAKAMEAARKMQASAREVDDRAEADRLMAVAHMQTGDTNEAEILLRGVLAAGVGEPLSQRMRAQVLFELAELYHRAGRTADALGSVRECRTVADSQDLLLAIRADMLEGKILHAAGQFADATRLYDRAYEAAERAGSMSERARASNSLGNAARDCGQYAVAQDHFLRALELWERMGDVECIAGARNNLGNLAMSLGDYAAAREHHQQSLTVCTDIGNVQGAALAQSNLAILALEEGDGPQAVTAAKEALMTLGDSGNALLRGLVLVVLGEGRVECGEAAGAQAVFTQVLKEFEESRHPLAVAGAYRGRGRVALLQRDYAAAVKELEHAIDLYERLNREQEATRARLYRAEAFWGLGDKDRARTELEQARKRLRRIRATRDTERADRLLKEMLDTSSL